MRDRGIAKISQLGQLLAVMGANVIACGFPVLAQITPDSTLGSERSAVTRGVEIRGSVGDRIDGGATRGANLFHSFQEFNVGNGQRVYFANPVGVQNIFSRVTGGNVSNILGTLGVDGGANLFLLNPNGILLGPNARLDIRGSFLATTADRFAFPNGSEFSATNPQAAPLLTLSVAPGLQYGRGATAHISSTGNLTTGQDLTLAAGNLNLQGQLQAGGNLTLQAQDTVQVRDSATQPFVASAGNQLLVQGNQSVDIFALNHPNSGFYSGSDLILRSANTVGGDAHYWAGGNFRIEQLDGSTGNLFSPYDPIILASGNVTLGDYTGASLHILAGGSVTLGNVTIDAADASNSIYPGNTTPFNATGTLGSLANVTLSDGSTITIQGNTTPTLDVRAGIDWAALGGFPSPNPLVIGTVPPTSNLQTTTPALSSNITLSSVKFGTASGGMVFLSNHYYPNLSVPSSTGISVGEINTSGNQGGGSVFIDSRSDITVNGRIVTSALSSGSSGNINLFADGNITLNQPLDTSLPFPNVSEGEVSEEEVSEGGGGEEEVSEGEVSEEEVFEGEVSEEEVFEEVFEGEVSEGSRYAGNVRIRAGGNIHLNQTYIDTSANSLPSGSENEVTGANQLQGTAGWVSLNANKDIILDNGFISASGKTAGYIFSQSKGDTVLKGTGIYASTSSSTFDSNDSDNGDNRPGEIFIGARSLFATEYSTLNTSSYGSGDAGDIRINTQDQVAFDKSFIYTRFDGSGQGIGGSVRINTGSLFMANGAILDASTSGQGDIGSITVNATSLIDLSGGSQIRGEVEAGASGSGNEIVLHTRSLSVSGGSRISASTSGSGKAGTIQLGSTDNPIQQIILSGDNSGLFADTQSSQRTIGKPVNNFSEGDDAGKLLSNAKTIPISDESVFSSISGTLSSPNDVDLYQIKLSGDKTFSATTVSGKVSDAQVADTQLFLFDWNGIGVYSNDDSSSSTLRSTIPAYDSLTPEKSGTYYLAISSYGITPVSVGDLNIFSAFASTDINGPTGEGGNSPISDWRGDGSDSGSYTIRLTGLSGDTRVTKTIPGGSGGSIEINAGALTITDKAQISATTKGNAGNAGNITVNANTLNVNGGGKLLTTTSGKGQAGDITLGRPTNRINTINIDGADTGVFSNATVGAGGNGGNLAVYANSIAVSNAAQLSATTEGAGKGGDVKITAPTVTLLNHAAIKVDSNSTASNGSAGKIEITANTLKLDRASITATTKGGNGGDINLTIRDLLLMRHGSEISTQAGTPQSGGNGGVITIDAQKGFVIAVPDENSDILANAFGGNGGRIEINAYRVLGFQLQSRLNSDQISKIRDNGTSDISASSDVGSQGEIQINSLSIDPSQGLVELPVDVVDPSNSIAQGCGPESGTVANRRSEFVVTGRGGLPPSPDDPQTGGATPAPWVSRNTNNSATARATRIPEPTASSDPELVEAQGIRIATNGEVLLTANTAAATPHQSGFSNKLCPRPKPKT